MNVTEEILKKERYKKIVDGLSKQTLKLLAEDRLNALKAAHKGIEEIEPERVNDMDYLEVQADAMQSFAKSLLAKRTKK